MSGVRTTQQGEEEDYLEGHTVEHSSVQPKAAAESENHRHHHHHGAVELVGGDPGNQPPIQTTVAELDRSKGRFGYLKKRQFWIVLCLSQALAVTNTGTNTLTTLLADEGTSIPAFQSLFNVC